MFRELEGSLFMILIVGVVAFVAYNAVKNTDVLGAITKPLTNWWNATQPASAGSPPGARNFAFDNWGTLVGGQEGDGFGGGGGGAF
jgi:hypothetical protein